MEKKPIERDIVYADEKGTVRIVDGNLEPTGWYCICGAGHDYKVRRCSCGRMRKR